MDTEVFDGGTVGEGAAEVAIRTDSKGRTWVDYRGVGRCLYNSPAWCEVGIEGKAGRYR